MQNSNYLPCHPHRQLFSLMLVNYYFVFDCSIYQDRCNHEKLLTGGVMHLKMVTTSGTRLWYPNFKMEAQKRWHFLIMNTLEAQIDGFIFINTDPLIWLLILRNENFNSKHSKNFLKSNSQISTLWKLTFSYAHWLILKKPNSFSPSDFHFFSLLFPSFCSTSLHRFFRVIISGNEWSIR